MYVFGRIPYSTPLSLMYTTWEYKPLTKAQAQQTNHLSEGKKRGNSGGHCKHEIFHFKIPTQNLHPANLWNLSPQQHFKPHRYIERSQVGENPGKPPSPPHTRTGTRKTLAWRDDDDGLWRCSPVNLFTKTLDRKRSWRRGKKQEGKYGEEEEEEEGARGQKETIWELIGVHVALPIIAIAFFV